MTPDPAQEIGYVLKMFPRLSETFIANEILELERQGLAIRIFSLKRPDCHFPQKQVRAPVVYLPQRVYREPLRVLRAHFSVIRRYPKGWLRMFRHVLRRKESFSIVRGMRRFSQACCLIREKGGLIHLHAHFASDPTRIASWVQMISKIPYSITTHAKDLYQGARVDSPGFRNKASCATFLVANSEFSSNGIRSSFNGKQPPRLYRIYNGLDLTLFYQRSKEPVDPMILGVGRLIEKKGFHDLLQACKLLADRNVTFRCEIIGSGELRDTLKALITGLNLQDLVKLRGEMSQTKVRELYDKAMVFALPCIVSSNGDRDILPNVVKEAMAVGVPVVTTSIGGMEELVTSEESGLLVPPGDREALALALERLLTDPGLRKRLVNRARKVIEERFDARENFKLLKDLLSEGGAKGMEQQTAGIEEPEPVAAETGREVIWPEVAKGIEHDAHSIRHG